MSKYLFVFGYESPEENASNEQHGSDYESSTAFFIDAPSEEAALEWGRNVAQAYVAHLYAPIPYTWLASNYAHWIEHDPVKAGWQPWLTSLPIVNIGEMPDFNILGA